MERNRALRPGRRTRAGGSRRSEQHGSLGTSAKPYRSLYMDHNLDYNPLYSTLYSRVRLSAPECPAVTPGPGPPGPRGARWFTPGTVSDI
eukprot:768505-Hanusia_phi.AAC.3